jgi:4-aminobutyrate aminotransferase-like enzyme/Ser/Thr protein kinase RdoA (MazF antagonist)
MSLHAHTPRFTPADAESIAHEHYALDARAGALASERDQNFLLTTAAGERFVLKIANALEPHSVLEAQQLALAHVGSTLGIVPRVLPALGGATITEVVTPDGRMHFAWLITYLDGMPFATLGRRTHALLEDFGRRIGALNASLASFDHPAIHREFDWDLARARDVIAAHRPLVSDPALGAVIDGIMERTERDVAPLLPLLRVTAIHNDLNDHNVIVCDGGDPFTRHQQVSGIVDFGDMLHSFTVSDLAIAAAYVCLGATDPLADLAAIVRGYHAEYPLEENERIALFGLVLLRLATSACMAARQRADAPDNTYLDVSQEAIRRMLPVLARIPHGLAHAVVREACGLEPVATSARVREWLGANTARFAPLLDVDLRGEPCTVFDLSVASPLVAGDPALNTERFLTPRLDACMREAGVAVGIGRYDEPRLLYTAPFFAGLTPEAERRTMHIGFDLFAPAGTPVHAPMDGVVHAFADNHVLQDYGPVIILRHETDDGIAFYTLYGHLARSSLEGLAVGQAISRGERFATFGTPDENVGWTPHLHLQVITDLLGLDTDFPGVGSAAQRATWRSLSPDPNLIIGVPASRFPAPTPAMDVALARRRALFAGNLSIAYREPVRVARGWKQYLFDDEGHRFIDAYNNVPHVGHAHPRVVRAAAEQMAVLNTNTRYLNDVVTRYAERLVATLPAALDTCMLVSSASEANELALRLARARTGRRDMLVLDAAYHGNTTTLIDISPYKHAGPGGEGAPPWVHVAPLPDDYRGPFRRGEADVGARYAAQVAALIAQLPPDAGLAGFIAETCPSVGGQLILPSGYLAAVYASVRAAGGVCIADEVQTGLGRMGTHFWAFEAHDVVPDIVVMGKPLGNGHPLAAVVTTRAIAEAFDTGMEYFSTFGGNTVSCAVGLAVLDVMRDEALQAHALHVGNRLLHGLRALGERFALVGDVRGSGLFLGVELVRDRETRDPAAAEASYVANRMRERGVLLGTDGPYHNVVKIRPPMPFDEDDARVLITGLEQTLGELT